MTADRNLLLGILALQMDFITRDQLIEAMNGWVLDKNQSLEEVLFNQGRLSKRRCELLATLVEEHLAEHHDDVQQSLSGLLPRVADGAALSSQIEDADVQASLAAVSALRNAPTDLQMTAQYAAPDPASPAMRFRVLRPHARGGLGQVSVALDEELGREVALKEIQQRYADSDANRSRFLMEAEVTGALEHPGIVPVYGKGQHADGRPFYAMRLIRGRSLKDAISDFHGSQDFERQNATKRSLELRNLLGRVIDVCDAIGYAHSRGVLHRDVKPDNVMLGKFGETLVVDWGLAKMVDRDDQHGDSADEATLKPGSSSGSAPTMFGAAIGTPAYMSPEQAGGRLEQLGPTTDIYSLGATLYAVLTGCHPYETVAESDDLLRRVQLGDFPRPVQRNGRVPPALESICLKAMARKPSDRYQTASSLAEDLKHWLADEPVAAHRESLGQRLGRWARNHRSYVRAGVIGLLLTTGIAIAAAVATNAARQQEAFERVRANENAERERKAAEAARIAEQEAQTNLTRALVAEAETVEALDEAREQARVSAEVSDFLVNLFLGSDPTGLGGGLSAVDQRGKDLSAVALLEYGAESLDRKLSGRPEVRARLLDTLGFIFTTYAEYARAEPLLDEALRLRRELFNGDHPQLADSLKNSGVFYYLTGNYRKARKYEREALAIRQRHFGPASGPAAEMMFILGWHISGGYTNASLLRESEQLLRRSIKIQESLYAADDQRLVFARIALAHTLLQLERPAEGMLQVTKALQGLNEAKGDSRPGEIMSSFVRGLAAERMQNWEEAKARMGHALEVTKEMFGERHSFVPYFQGPIAKYLERAGDHEAAEDYLRRLVEAERRIFSEGHWVAFRLDDLAAFLVRQGQFEEAQRQYEEALQIRHKAVGPDSLFVGLNLKLLAEVAEMQGDLTRARQLYRESLAVYDAAAEDHPETVAAWRADVARALEATK